MGSVTPPGLHPPVIGIGIGLFVQAPLFGAGAVYSKPSHRRKQFAGNTDVLNG